MNSIIPLLDKGFRDKFLQSIITFYVYVGQLTLQNYNKRW